MSIFHGNLIFSLCLMTFAGLGLQFNKTFLAPTIGLALSIIIISALGFFNILTPLVSKVIFISFLLLTLKQLHKNWRLVVVILIFGNIAFSLFWYEPYSSDTYNVTSDAVTYLIHSQWLQNHLWSESILTPSSYTHPAYGQVMNYQIAANVGRMGQSFFMAWIQGAFNIDWSYKVYPIATTLPAICGALVIWSMTNTRVIGGLFALFTAISLNGFTAGGFIGFYPQVFGLCFTLALIATIDLILLPGLFLAGIFLCYPEISPFVLATIVSFQFGKRFQLFKSVPSVNALAIIILAFAFSFFCIKYMIVGTFKAIFAFGVKSSIPVGWPIHFSILDFLGQIAGLQSELGQNSHLFSSDFVSVFFTLLIIITAIYGALKNKPLGIPLITLSFFLSLMFLKQRYFTQAPNPNEIGHSYLQWKITLWLSAPTLALVGLAFKQLEKKAYSYLITIFFISVLLGASLFNHIGRYYPPTFTNYLLAQESLKKCEYPIYIKNIPTVFFGSTPFVLSYFLRDKNLIGGWYDDKEEMNEIIKTSDCTVTFSNDWSTFEIENKTKK